MRTLFTVVAIAAVIAGCGSTPSEGPVTGDPITPEINGGFEVVSSMTTNVDGWSSNLWDWMVLRSEKAHTGTWAVEFYRSADNVTYSEATLFSYRFDVTAGTEYAVSLAAINPSGPMRLRIAWYDMLGECIRTSAGECAATVLDVPEGGSIYRTISGTAVVPPSTKAVVGDIFITATLPMGGRAYVDDVSLTPVR